MTSNMRELAWEAEMLRLAALHVACSANGADQTRAGCSTRGDPWALC
jgi:hypothetical protein